MFLGKKDSEDFVNYFILVVYDRIHYLPFKPKRDTLEIKMNIG